MKSRLCLHAAARSVYQHWFLTKGCCLLYVVDSIDAYLGPLCPQKALNAACQGGAMESTLEYFLSRTTPNWKKAVRAAAQGGHLHVLRWMTNRQDGRGPWKADFDSVLEVAASRGYLNVVEWLFERGTNLYTLWKLKSSTPGYYAKAWAYELNLSRGLQRAAANGHLAVVQRLHGARRKGFACDPMYYAVEGGHLKVAQWLFKNGVKESKNAANAAAEEGHLEILQWLHSKGISRCTDHGVDGAAKNGHLDVLKWLHKTLRGGCRTAKLYLPIQNGHLEVTKWLDNNVPPCVTREMGSSATFAARYGHVEILNWLHQHFTYLFSEIAMDVAAETGRLDVLIWLHENRTEGCSHMAPWHAAEIGHLEMVKWLHEHYSDKFTACALDVAAANGHLDVVQWLHENRPEGCTAGAMKMATYKGHLEVARWLLMHRSEGFSSSAVGAPQNVEVMCSLENEFSTRNDAIECILRELRSMNPAFVEGCLRCMAEVAFHRGHVPILEWIGQFDIKLLSTVPIRRAVARGDLGVVKWLHQNCFEMFERDLLQLAVRNGHIEVTCWLSEHGYDLNAPDLVLLAAESKIVTLVRWLLENGSMLDLPTAATLARTSEYVEAMWWVSEPVRVQLVLEAMQNENHNLLWWLLMRTSFEEKASQMTISSAIAHDIGSSMREWLLENIDSDEVCQWCFSRKKIALWDQDDTSSPSAKRARQS